MGYTLAQIKLYLQAIEDQEKHKKLEMLSMLRAAQADSEGFDKIWRNLIGS